MQPMQMESSQVLKSFTLKLHTKQQMLMGNKRGITKEEKHQELQDQDLLGSITLKRDRLVQM